MNYHKFVNNDYKIIERGGRRRRSHRLPLAFTVIGLALGISAFSYLGDSANIDAAADAPKTMALEIPEHAATAPSALETGARTDQVPAVMAVATAAPAASPAAEISTSNAEPAVAETAGQAAVPPPVPAAKVLEAGVRPGDSLALIFRRLGVPAAELAALTGDRETKRRLSRIRPGQQIKLVMNRDNTLQSLIWKQDRSKTLEAHRGEKGFSVHVDEASLTTQADAPKTIAPELPDQATTPPPALEVEGRADQVPAVIAVATAAPVASPAAEVSTSDIEPALEETAGQAAVTPSSAPAVKVIEASVRPGDSLALIFRRLDVPAAELAALTSDRETKRQLSRIRPGQQLKLVVDGDNTLQTLIWKQDRIKTLEAHRGEKGFSVHVDEVKLTTQQVAASGLIKSSLFEAGIEAGLSDRTIMEMAEILGWDIDFAQDLRDGDRFTVLYEQHLNAQGEKIKDGHIVALEFINQGRTISALRYTKSAGESDYYSADGHSMRKAFRRMPVRFGRVSSGFTKARWHPVLHRFRAHKGVDYAAPRGTPILATGDGKVVFRGTKGGYGKTIVLKHGEQYSTLYGHMSGYGKGTATGSRVKQGQVIGYVGSTGLATGPHVHYEFRVSGVHRDPLRVKLPKALPLERKYMADFREKATPLMARLDRLRRTQLALNDE